MSELFALIDGTVIQYTVDALSSGSFYALVSLGIALVFGIMRAINFAYSEMIMVSALAFFALRDLPLPMAVLGAIAVAVVLGLLIERIAFRPLRDADHATLLITSFAVAYLLNNLGTIVIGDKNMAMSLGWGLSDSIRIGDVTVAAINLVTIAVTLILLGGLTWFLKHHPAGVQMRAAAEDFRTAQILGVKGNRVIALGFALSGVLAGIIAVLLVGRTGTVDSTMGLAPVLFALVATTVGGMGSLTGAVLGGYLIGIAFVGLQVVLPVELRPYRDAFLFALVLIFFVVRPDGLIRGPLSSLRADAAESAVFLRRRGAAVLRSRGEWSTVPLLALLVVAVALIGGSGPAALGETTSIAMVMTVVVVGLYIFVGNSGVFSFGHLAFMAVGAYVTAILTIPTPEKELLFEAMPGLLQSLNAAPVVAVGIGGLAAAAAGLALAGPLMRLNGLAAALGTLAILLIVHTIAKHWAAVTNGSAGMSGVDGSFGLWTLLPFVIGAIGLAFAYQQTRSALRLRAAREDQVSAEAIGVSVARSRTLAFVISAFVVGVGGGLFTMTVGSIHPDAFYVWDTFLVMAMLVVGGIGSLSGAVVGVMVVSIVGELLRRFEDGVELFGYIFSAPAGMREVGVSALMLAVLIFRPGGIMSGTELRLPRRLSRSATRLEKGSRLAPAGESRKGAK